jgi:DNA-binding transcriptional LysR family regulator
MKLNSAQLDAFFTVAKTLNFTKAAVLLHVTQSALSQRIANLEAELETSLFIRDRGSLRLTEEGHQVLRFCQWNHGAEEELLLDLKGTSAEFGGVLRLAGLSSVTRSLLLPSLRKIMTQNPNLSLHLMTQELMELDDMLRRGEADYIITYGESLSPQIQSVFLGFEENVLVASKRFPRSEIYLDHDEMDPTTKEFFLKNKMKFNPKKMRYLDDVYGLIDGVRNGFGLAVLPRHLIANLKDLEVVDAKKNLCLPVFLQFFRQPYYKRIHEPLLKELTVGFRNVLRQGKIEYKFP